MRLQALAKDGCAEACVQSTRNGNHALLASEAGVAEMATRKAADAIGVGPEGAQLLG